MVRIESQKGLVSRDRLRVFAQKAVVASPDEITLPLGGLFREAKRGLGRREELLLRFALIVDGMGQVNVGGGELRVLRNGLSKQLFGNRVVYSRDDRVGA